MTPLFIATQKFGPAHEPRWHDYVAWSGLTQLDEVVSLDHMLCGRVLTELKDTYWPHIVHEDFMLDYFVDLEFMLSEIGDMVEINTLCVFKSPSAHPTAPSDTLPFEFMGYDLIDTQTSVSALSNCLGYQKAFSSEEINAVGLLDSFERACEVQKSLRKHYPNDGHADCDRWAIFRAVG